MSWSVYAVVRGLHHPHRCPHLRYSSPRYGRPVDSSQPAVYHWTVRGIRDVPMEVMAIVQKTLPAMVFSILVIGFPQLLPVFVPFPALTPEKIPCHRTRRCRLHFEIVPPHHKIQRCLTGFSKLMAVALRLVLELKIR